MTKPPSRPRLSEIDRRRLCGEAVDAAEQAHAPYSRFRVGAAVLAESGRIYRGANVENASYGLGICAERVALATTRVAGERRIVAIAVACVDAAADAGPDEKVPCGACRQWLQELAADAEIIIVGEDGSLDLSQLLPRPFKLRR